MTNRAVKFSVAFQLINFTTLEAYAKAFGLLTDPQFVIHALRHTCATRLMAAGVDVVTVQHWLGHKDISTTMRYATLCQSD